MSGFHQGILKLAMEPSVLGTALMEGGPDRKILLDRSPGVDEVLNINLLHLQCLNINMTELKISVFYSLGLYVLFKEYMSFLIPLFYNDFFKLYHIVGKSPC